MSQSHELKPEETKSEDIKNFILQNYYSFIRL